jgi:lipopolysaccharide transport system ATP-binding protein
MSDAIITVENLSKKYLIGHQTGQRGRSRYVALRDVIGREVRNVARKTMDVVRGRQVLQGSEVEDFWALKDVSFEVKRGEVLGIIGRNGAGKSTLLKILSRITEPTQGRITLRGRVASLLEVGTGFHPELTGRENIFLNGAILGMTRAEIKRKFDEIVDFAEVEKFLDTAVKHYSSGMYVRLAFAVAAHLEPEILIVDEVLAVGDGEFQKKCLGKMGEIAGGGRTVLFVSHNMGTIADLTERTVLLDHGRVAEIAKSQNVIANYLKTSLQGSTVQLNDLDYYRRHTNPHSPVKIIAIDVSPGKREPGTIPTCEIGQKFIIEIHIEVTRILHKANIYMALKTLVGDQVTVLVSWDQNFALSVDPGRHVITVRINDLPLSPGFYFLNVGIDPSMVDTYDAIHDFPLLSIVNSGQITHWLERPWGILHCNSVDWAVSETTSQDRVLAANRL